MSRRKPPGPLSNSGRRTLQAVTGTEMRKAGSGSMDMSGEAGHMRPGRLGMVRPINGIGKIKTTGLGPQGTTVGIEAAIIATGVETIMDTTPWIATTPMTATTS